MKEIFNLEFINSAKGRYYRSIASERFMSLTEDPKKNAKVEEQYYQAMEKDFVEAYVDATIAEAMLEMGHGNQFDFFDLEAKAKRTLADSDSLECEKKGARDFLMTLQEVTLG